MADQMSDDVYNVLFLVLIFNGNNMRVTGRVRACVFNTYARHRTNQAKFTVADIDFTLCTHYIYYRASLNATTKQIVPDDSSAETSADGLYARFNHAKQAHPEIKTLLTVGGPELAQSVQFMRLFVSSLDLQTFAGNTVRFLRKHHFDGINLDSTMYPLYEDKQNFTNLLRALRTAIDQDNNNNAKLLLTMVGHVGHVEPGHFQLVYDITEIGKLVDYVFVMADQFSSRRFATFNGPLFPGTNPNISPHANVNTSIHTWNHEGCPVEKMVLGVSARGNFVKLASPETQFEPGAPITNDVLHGDVYSIDGAVAFPEVCRRYTTGRRYYDNIQKNPYLVQNDEWIGYEDTVSLWEKITYVRDMGLAGIMLNNIDEDDFNASECQLGKFPLVSYINSNLDLELTTTNTTTKSTTATTVTTTTVGGTIPGQTTALPTITSDGANATIEENTTETPVTPRKTITPRWSEEFETTSTEAYSSGPYTFPPAPEDMDHRHVIQHVLLVLLFILGYGLGSFCMWCVRGEKPPSSRY